VAVTFLATACGSSSPTEGVAGESTTETIGPEGGAVHLDRVGTVTFPPGAFSSPTTVKFETTADPATDDLFAETSLIFELGKRAPYEIRINTGGIQPTAPLQLSLNMPRDFGPLGTALAQVLEASDLDALDQFEMVRGTTDGFGTGVITMSLRSEYVTNSRRADGTFEGVIVLAQIPVVPGPVITGQQSVEPGKTHILAGEGGENACAVTRFASPVDPLSAASPFNLDGSSVVNGKTHTGHFGVDLRAVSGEPLYSIGRGTVLYSATSTRFGESVILKISGVGAVRYAHMKSRSVAKGEDVTCGQVIGEAEDVVHFELSPRREYPYDPHDDAKVDPYPCIDSNACVYCPFNVEFKGSAKYTLHQVYNQPVSNDADDDIVVSATNVTLAPSFGTNTEGYLRPTVGNVTYSRTRTTHTGGVPCTSSTTGAGAVVPGPPVTGALVCLAPSRARADGGFDVFYATPDPLVTRVKMTTTDTCGPGYEAEENVPWLTIPSVSFASEGFSEPHDGFKLLAGSYSLPGPGNTQTWEWNFTRVAKK
jgi:hypothetical protein